jgi:hypothetical protein
MMQTGEPITDYSLFDIRDEFLLEDVIWFWNGLMANTMETATGDKETTPPLIWQTGLFFNSA